MSAPRPQQAFDTILPRRDWQAHEPQWARDVGLLSTASTSRWIYATTPYRAAVRADGLYQLEPVVTAFRAHPTEIRSKIGKAAWRRFHHAEKMHNAWRAKLIILTKLPLEAVLDIPTGGLRRAFQMTKRVGTEAAAFAAHRAKNGKDMIALADLAHDLIRMGGGIDDTWTANRLRREHDAAAERWTMKFASPEKWAEEWVLDYNGFKFTLLRSEQDFKIEAITQKHCVASYHDRAKAGREIVFRIEGRERATVAWNRLSKHMEIKAHRNQPVSSSCKAAAHVALSAYMERSA